MSLAIEQHVLGGVLMEPGRLDDIGDISDLFSGRGHGFLYRAALEAYREIGGLDLGIFWHRVKGDNSRNPKHDWRYLAYLTECWWPGTLDAHVKILQRYAAKRDFEVACKDGLMACKADDPSVDSAVVELREDLDRISMAGVDSIHSMEDIMALSEVGPTRFVTTGYTAIDRYVMGWKPGTMVVIAARPSIGKSALGLQFATKAAMNGHGVGVMSSEMGVDDVRNRLLAAQSGIEHFEIRSGRVNPEDPAIMQARADFYELPIFIDDKAHATPARVRALVGEVRRRHGRCDLVVVDYLQRLDPDTLMKGRNREQEVAAVARALQQDARSMDVTVLAMAQLGRRTEHAGTSKRPGLHDLRESGVIEADADLVMLLWHENPMEFKEDLARVKLTIAKNRNGPLGEIEMMFNKPLQRFT